VRLTVCAADLGCAHTGIDMTDAQLAFANKHSTAWQQHLGYAQPNMRWVGVTPYEVVGLHVAKAHVRGAVWQLAIPTGLSNQ
jgi:hypothetical protein